MKRFFSLTRDTVFTPQNLWGLDAPLFIFLATQALQPMVNFFTVKSLLLSGVFWLGRGAILMMQRKFPLTAPGSWLGAVILPVSYVLMLVHLQIAVFPLGQFIPLLFLFVSSYTAIARPGRSVIAWKLVPMSATVVGGVFGYLIPAPVNSIPVWACFFGGAAHWFLSREKDPAANFLSFRIHGFTVLALLVAGFINRN